MADSPSEPEMTSDELRAEYDFRAMHGVVRGKYAARNQTHPLAEFVGMFKDDSLIEEWKQSMREYRRNRDKDADKP